ncbi:glucose-6-phosphate isomerase [Pseudanabaena sp. FACHB-1998]|uniref:glucose-6-phosphate isomerase n=1 Tax=Pseudanabaena sp. FACHB-1998 TaxID=2692858 RepID=UPI001680D711|nr:glucose-6-phosphate isomerase [Pseudanabaena sp. FACHB-1998]MBD2178744.1 glucose-6-phosphate isomerase [Pseudanabaena sp. FACHB-1998]
MNSAVELWQRYQDWLYYHSDLGLYIDISRMRFTPDFVTQMQPKFVKAFEDMKALESGAIANPDEQRMVGHYWLRTPELAPHKELADDITKTLDRIEVFTQKVHAGIISPPVGGKFTDILSIGIGGSALGPQFVAQCFSKADVPLKISFIDNSDPDGIDLVLDLLGDRLKTTLVLVISKSGGTPEAANAMKEVEFAFQQAGLNFAQQAIAITGVGSALEKYAIGKNWLDTFPMYDWIGGRTSELSAVGLLPAALQGIDIRAMLQGASIMDAATRIEDIRQNPAALLAMAWHFAGNGKGEKDMVILPYKDRLLLFSRYLQQLVMESLGKEQDLDGNFVYQGIAVYGNKGSTDQHAYVQQLREGVPNFFATFIEVLQDSQKPHPEIEEGVVTGDYLLGFLQGTRSALYENGRDSITVTIPCVSESTVGALIALYERAVSFYASLVNINAYHQPGVEAGKKAGAKVLALQKQLMDALKASTVSLSLEEVAVKLNSLDEIEAIYHIARHLHANGKILLEGELSKPATLKMMLLPA